VTTSILTWDGSDAGYAPSKYAADIAATRSGGEASDRWSMGSRRGGTAAGDRVFLLRQGTDRGIVASGRLTDGVVFASRHWADAAGQAYYAYVTWERVVPVADRLPFEELVAGVPGHDWNHIHGSSQELHPPADEALSVRWNRLVAGLDGVPRPEGVLPNWTWDETVLAYNLYLRDYADPLRYPDAAHPGVRNLSTLLRRLPLHAPAFRSDPRFRNPSGVARKVQNLMWHATGGRSGSAHGSALDEAVVAQLTDPAEVRRIAQAIDEATDELGDVAPISASNETGGALEGAVLEFAHRRRERDPKLVRQKKDALRKQGEPLVCEACGVDVAARYDLAGGSVIEVHHLVPLAAGVRTTTLADLAVVCPTCHRALHSRSRWGTIQELHEHLHRPSLQLNPETAQGDDT